MRKIACECVRIRIVAHHTSNENESSQNTPSNGKHKIIWKFDKIHTKHEMMYMVQVLGAMVGLGNFGKTESMLHSKAEANSHHEMRPRKLASMPE
jgi:hypothetical protein